MVISIDFPYEGIDAVQIPSHFNVTVIEPNIVPKNSTESVIMIADCIENPIGTKRLREEVVGCKNVLILADDYTRLTPTHLVLPALIEELVAGGVELQHITVMVASGTHRGMTSEEKLKKYGRAVLDSVTVVDHVWYDESQLTNLGSTSQGTNIFLNSLLLKSDFVLGVGHIVPHRVAGFSGGAKIVQPGVCGEITTGQTHWLSAKSFVGKDIMGIMDNPVRKEINEVGRRAGLKFIFNTVQDGNGDLHACFCGDSEEAFAVGCGVSLSVFGCRIANLSDIVISDAYPSHMNMWQAAKGIFSGDLALKEDGILILVASCSEGVANEHPQVEAYGYADPDRIEEMVESGDITDLTVAAHILHIGRVITGKRKAYLVSTGLSKERTEHIGFIWAESVQKTLDLTLLEKGTDATISVIKHAGEVMPIL